MQNKIVVGVSLIIHLSQGGAPNIIKLKRTKKPDKDCRHLIFLHVIQETHYSLGYLVVVDQKLLNRQKSGSLLQKMNS